MHPALLTAGDAGALRCSATNTWQHRLTDWQSAVGSMFLLLLLCAVRSCSCHLSLRLTWKKWRHTREAATEAGCTHILLSAWLLFLRMVQSNVSPAQPFGQLPNIQRQQSLIVKHAGISVQLQASWPQSYQDSLHVFMVFCSCVPICTHRVCCCGFSLVLLDMSTLHCLHISQDFGQIKVLWCGLPGIFSSPVEQQCQLAVSV